MSDKKLTGKFNNDQPSSKEVYTFVNEMTRAGDLAGIKSFLDTYPQSVDAQLVDNRGAKGWSALMIAAANGQKQIVQELLARGANPDLSTDGDRRAVQFADREGQREISAILRAASQAKRAKPDAPKL